MGLSSFTWSCWDLGVDQKLIEKKTKTMTNLLKTVLWTGYET